MPVSQAVAIAAALFLAAAGPACADQQMVIRHNLDEVQWQSPPSGVSSKVQSSMISGSLHEPGVFIVLFKFPADHVVPAHYHPAAEAVTILSGGLSVGMGDKLDKSKSELIGPGGYVWLPENMAHYGWTTEPTVIQVEMAGPFHICYVNPADDPRPNPTPDLACAGSDGARAATTKQQPAAQSQKSH